MSKTRGRPRTNFSSKAIATSLKQREGKSKYVRTPRGRFANLRGKCNFYGLECDLTFEDFQQLISYDCFYECGRKLDGGAGSSLDRLDPTRGYTKDNVVPCCAICNRIKGDQWSYQEMLVANRAVNALRARLAQETPEAKAEKAYEVQQAMLEANDKVKDADAKRGSR